MVFVVGDVTAVRAHLRVVTHPVSDVSSDPVGSDEPVSAFAFTGPVGEAFGAARAACFEVADQRGAGGVGIEKECHGVSGRIVLSASMMTARCLAEGRPRDALSSRIA